MRRVTDDDKRIYFAKAFTYPLVAAPLVALMGTRGLLVTNALALGLALVLAYLELRTRASPAWALAAAVVARPRAPSRRCTSCGRRPSCSRWPSWPRASSPGGGERPMLAAVLLGIATYTKPYNLFLALPLGVEPLLARRPRVVVARLARIAAARPGHGGGRRRALRA